MKKHKQKPNWRPISDLPLIAYLIDGGLEDSEREYKLFLEAKEKPHILDDAIVNRAIRLSDERAEFIEEMYKEQLLRWQREELTESERKEVERLSCQNERLRKLNKKLCLLLQELKKYTINRIMEMDDVELAVKTLAGEIPFPSSMAEIFKPCGKYKPKKTKGSIIPFRSKLTFNSLFIEQFLNGKSPCAALGVIEEQKKEIGFIAIKPPEAIPAEVMSRGFSFGQRILGQEAYVLIHFILRFYDYKDYHILLNANNDIVRHVLNVMGKTEDYFFFAFSDSGGMTAFRSDMGENSGWFDENLDTINNSMTTPDQYRSTYNKLSRTKMFPGEDLRWVCHDKIEFMDLEHYRLEANPC